MNPYEHSDKTLKIGGVMNNNLKELRNQRKISENELAFALNVSKETIRKWETQEEFPLGKELYNLCRYFSVSPEFFRSFDIPDFSEIRKLCINKLRESLESNESREVFTYKERASINNSLKKGYIPKLEFILKFEELIGRDWTCITVCEFMEHYKSRIFDEEEMTTFLYAQQKVPKWYSEHIKKRKNITRRMCIERVTKVEISQSDLLLEETSFG